MEYQLDALLFGEPDVPDFMEGESAYYRVGNVRARTTADEVVLAPSFVFGLAAQAPCGEGWLFLSDAGVLAFAHDFTGPLEHLLDLPVSGLILDPELARLRGGERASIVVEGRLIDIRCEPEASPRASTTDVERVTSAHLTETHGIAITEGGMLVRPSPTDAWRPFDLGERTPIEVRDVRGRSLLRTADGYFWFENGGLHQVSAPPPESPEVLEKARRRGRADGPRIRAAMRAHGVLPWKTFDLGDDVRLLSPATPADRFGVLFPNGSLIPVADSPCEPIHWGHSSEGLWLLCGCRMHRLVVEAESATLREVVSFAHDHDVLMPVTSRVVLLEGADAPGCRDRAACWFDVQSRRGTPVVMPANGILVAAGHRQVVACDIDEDVRCFHATEDQRRFSPLPSAFDGAQEVHIANDGSLWAVVSSGEDLALVTRVGDRAQVVSTPADAFRFRIDHRESVFAFGLRRAWHSSDFGATWSPIPRAARIDAEHDPALLRAHRHTGYFCEEGQCIPPFTVRSGDEPFPGHPILGRDTEVSAWQH